MSEDQAKTANSASPSEERSFLRRWSERKARAGREAEPAASPAQELTDADMPPVESLDDQSDYSGFLSPKVSEALRRQALRKLFHSAAFNTCDGLDDYAEDFTRFTPLGEVITQDLRHRLEVEAKRLAQAPEQPAESPADPPAQPDRVPPASEHGEEESVV